MPGPYLCLACQEEVGEPPTVCCNCGTRITWPVTRATTVGEVWDEAESNGFRVTLSFEPLEDEPTIDEVGVGLIECEEYDFMLENTDLIHELD